MAEQRHRIRPQLRDRARAFRHPQTPPEATLWRHLRDGHLGGHKFRRQHVIGRFIADFYCAACRLIVELDGDSHSERAGYDAFRTAWLRERGYHVFRVANSDVYRRLDLVLEGILVACERLLETQGRGGRAH